MSQRVVFERSVTVPARFCDFLSVSLSTSFYYFLIAIGAVSDIWSFPIFFSVLSLTFRVLLWYVVSNVYTAIYANSKAYISEIANEQKEWFIKSPSSCRQHRHCRRQDYFLFIDYRRAVKSWLRSNMASHQKQIPKAVDDGAWSMYTDYSGFPPQMQESNDGSISSTFVLLQREHLVIECRFVCCTRCRWLYRLVSIGHLSVNSPTHLNITCSTFQYISIFFLSRYLLLLLPHPPGVLFIFPFTSSFLQLASRDIKWYR